jgi:hypothetical protein
MELEEAFKAAAHAADAAVNASMKKYRDQGVTDEDDLTGILIGRLDAEFDKVHSGIKWSSSILRHRRGVAAQERKVGADMLIHVSLDVQGLKYSKGVLVQAKRVEEGQTMNASEHKELLSQCKKMLGVTPASFVFDYAMGSMRCASATKIAGTTTRDLYASCNLTPYRFFLELFRCTTGDPRITSSRFTDLPIPIGLSLKGVST